MKAALYDRYGGPEVLSVRDVPRASAGRGELAVRVRAAALNPKDIIIRSGRFRLVSGRRFPKRVGYDWAGEVIATGERRYGMMNGTFGGACAEEAVVRVAESAPMPAGLTFAEAAALPLVSLTALQALRDVAGVRGGERVLVNGGSGGVGTHAIQIARALGCRVTTTSSARNLELCRDLGADEALDYAADDPLRREGAFDVVFDVFGSRSFAEARRALTPHGTFVATVPKAHVFTAMARTVLSRPRARIIVVRSRTRDLVEIGRLVEAGKLRPVIDRTFPLAEIRAAEEYLGTRRARGKVVITT